MKFVALSVVCVAAASFLLGASPKDAKLGAKKHTVTYAGDVAPILNAKCVSCHRPGEVAPFSLEGYDNAKKWATMTANVTSKGIMPPWKAVHGFGEFRDENRLTPEQIEALREWSATGAPRGDRAKEPPTPSFAASEWKLGKPDMILQPSKPYKLGPEGPDLYRNYVIHTDFAEPKWITAMEVKPGNKRIVHHVITFLDGNRMARSLETKLADGQEGYTSGGGGVGIVPTGSLGGWAPGLEARQSPEGSAFLVKPGTDLIIQVHYHRDGKPEEDQTRVGLFFAKKPVQKEMNLLWLFNFGVNIPAGEKSYKLRREFTLPVDATLYSTMPHMHLLGHSMKAWLELPDGTTKPLVYIDNWDFNWQFNYAFKQPIHAPKGTKEIVEAVYDNSPENPRNPNSPPKRVTWGEETTDEMFLLITSYTRDGQSIASR